MMKVRDVKIATQRVHKHVSFDEHLSGDAQDEFLIAAFELWEELCRTQPGNCKR